ncbi:hypothetical protein R2A130_0002 [Ahrensia sp. R2A130]|nr:hypothetical protein R2A130_0002 [Ahrensia sp. R2A130]
MLLPEQRKVIIKKLESLKNVRDFLEHGRDTKTGTSAKPEVHNHNGCLIGDGAFLITADKVLMGGLELGEFQKELEVFEEWIGFMALHHKREFINRGLDWREVRLERSRGYLRFPYEDWE